MDGINAEHIHSIMISWIYLEVGFLYIPAKS
jgi:hypothetical protein